MLQMLDGQTNALAVLVSPIPRDDFDALTESFDTIHSCYTIDAVLIPSHGESNILVSYQVIESERD